MVELRARIRNGTHSGLRLWRGGWPPLVFVMSSSLPPPTFSIIQLMGLMVIDGRRTTQVASLSRCNHLLCSSISLSESYAAIVPLLPGRLKYNAAHFETNHGVDHIFSAKIFTRASFPTVLSLQVLNIQTRDSSLPVF